MKILALTPQFLPVLGGIEVFSDALARSLRRYSVETTIVADTYPIGILPEYEVIGGTAVHRLPFRKVLHALDTAASLNLLQRLIALIGAIEPDLIHMHSAVQGSAWYVDRSLAKLSPKPPFVVTQHGLLEAIDRIHVARALMLKADMLTGVSEAVLRSAVEFTGRTAATTVIYNGVEKHVRNAMPRRTPPFRLACVGRLQQEKGFDLAIKALASIRRDGVDASLTIVGQGEDRRSLLALTNALSLDQHVRFAGVLGRDETHDVIASSSLLLVPSRTREGFSLVAAEAALCGVPSVAARVGGLVETIEDGVTGVLVPPDDPNALAAAIKSVLLDSARLKAMGSAASRTGHEKFDIGRCAEQYFKVYSQLVR